MVSPAEVLATRGKAGRAEHMAVRGRLFNSLGSRIKHKIIRLYSRIIRTVDIESSIQRQV